MKDKNLPNDYNQLSLEELTKEANKMIEDLESQKNLENSIENYQNLLKLNNIIEKKFQKDVKNINEKTKENIAKITSKKNAKKLIKTLQRKSLNARQLPFENNLFRVSVGKFSNRKNALEYQRIVKKKSIDRLKYPDIILIDGGKGQYSSTKKALESLNVRDVTIISIAKGEKRNAGREKFYTSREKPFLFKPNDPMLFYLQRLRDEAHRFAIGTHKAKRKKEFTKNPLDEIPGIGQKRKKALLNFFGSAKAISRARLDELTSVDGISLNMAHIIFNWFNE